MISSSGFLMALFILFSINFLEAVLSGNITLADERKDPLPSHYETNSSIRLSSNLLPHKMARELNSSLRSGNKSDSYGHENSINFTIGKLIPCTNEEKICLSHSLVFLPQLDICVSIGYDIFRGCFTKIDEQEFTNRSGHVIGICERKKYLGTIFNVLYYHLVNDGKYHTKEEIHGMCGCDREPIPHVLGGYECSCTEYTPTHVEQPMEDGMCRIPDLRYPDDSKPVFKNEQFFRILKCSEKQAECFKESKIFLAEFQNCSILGGKGNCPDDHVLALNETAAANEIAESICVHQRGNCPVGYKRLAFDRKCYSDRELQIRSIHVQLQPFGDYDERYWDLTFRSICRISYLIFPTHPPLLRVEALPEWAVQKDSGQISGSYVQTNASKPSVLP